MSDAGPSYELCAAAVSKKRSCRHLCLGVQPSLPCTNLCLCSCLTVACRSDKELQWRHHLLLTHHCYAPYQGYGHARPPNISPAHGHADHPGWGRDHAHGCQSLPWRVHVPLQGARQGLSTEWQIQAPGMDRCRLTCSVSWPFGHLFLQRLITGPQYKTRACLVVLKFKTEPCTT